ncbi:MAG: iron-containing alcohol dehydrogenase [Bacilli bacterium]|nr:iron-containing alcohol dehydrogenase [Bacilli bacterium]
MNIFKKIYCRIFQMCFRIALPFLPYREPVILDSIKEIPNNLKNLSIKNILLITDKGIRNLGITKELEDILSKNNINCIVYDETLPNPTIDNIESARKLYVDYSCEALIAFGGGSPIDCAKAVGARIAYPKKTIGKLKGLLKIRRKIPLLIAIPTTAGTGSEVTLASVVSDPSIQHKYTLMDFNLIPRYAVLDPSVTVTLPPHLTSTTGLDALTHAIEAYIGRSTTSDTRKKAIEAIKLIFENIEEAYNNGSNLTARANMLKAAYLAGIAFSKSYVGYVHAVAHSLGGQYNIPHGLANAVLLPIVLEKYGKSIYKKLHKLSIEVGISSKDENKEESARKFIKAIYALNERMNIPKKLKGIKEEDIVIMSKHADKEANPLYPVPKLYNRKDLEKIYYLVKE